MTSLTKYPAGNYPAPVSLTEQFFHNFIKCGLTGWCVEILFNALDSFRRRDMRLLGTTSVWMFPIYGCAAFLNPVCRLLKHRPAWLRGITYMSLIFSTEFITGRLLDKHSFCPWNYGRSRWNVGQLIRLDYAPLWLAAGFLFEHILAAPSNTSSRN